MKVISLVNQKGGVAKTTTASALGVSIAKRGKRVLLIDFEPQGTLTTSFGIIDENNVPKAYQFLNLENKSEEVIPKRINERLEIITSNVGLETANMQLYTKIGRERFLRRAIEKLNERRKYDYVIIDSNPSLSVITTNVMYASDYIVVPFKPEFNSIKGVQQLFDNVASLQEIKPELKVLGFIVTMAVTKRSSTEECVE